MKTTFFIALHLLTTLVYSQTHHIKEDFNNATLPNGWTTNAVSGSQAWSFGADGANMHAGNQNIDGTAMAYFDDDLLGGSSTNNTAELRTPSFDNSIEPFTYLSFDYNFRAYSLAPDSFYVDVYDGSQWQRVFSREQSDCGNYLNCLTYPSLFIDISAYANNNCQVRFTYHDGNDWGFYVGLDNVQIWSPFANNLSVNEVIEPKNGCGLSTNDSIKVLIKNQGYQTQQNFDITFELNGNPTVIETISDSIAYQDSLIYTFSNIGNFSNFGLHDLKVYTLLSNDSNLANDTISVQITNDSAYQAPYFNDFESTNNGWTTTGNNSSWQWGVPSTNAIDTAFSGQHAWVTNLSGSYNSNELSYLTSPCFDLSQLSNDLYVNFKSIHLTEGDYDMYWLEVSTDFGQNWQKIPNTSISKNWYNNRIQKAWDGIMSQWKESYTIIRNLAGEPQVKFRYVFVTDNNTQLEGVGIDDFSIRERQAVDLSIEKINYPTFTSNCGFGSKERLVLELINFGVNPVDSFLLFYQLDGLAPDSEWVSTNIDTLSHKIYTSQHRFDFSQLKSYTLKTWVKAAGDTNPSNDTIFKSFTNNINTSAPTLPYNENFDGFANFGKANQLGWTTTHPNSTYGWNSHKFNTFNNETGPSNDHTNGTGNYIYLRTSFLTFEDNFISPCINFNSDQGAILSFWYHRYGSEIQPLYVDYFNGINWVNVKTITRQPQTSSSSAWTYEEVFLPLSGMISKIRFRGNSSGSDGQVAIDDLNIRSGELQLKNLSETRACQLNNKLEVVVQLNNYTIANLAADSIYISYTIDNNTVANDTISQAVASNANYIHSFADSIDLNQQANQFEVKVNVRYSDTSLIAPAEMAFMYYQAQALTDFTEDFESYDINHPNSSLWNYNENWQLMNDTMNNNHGFPRNDKTPIGNQFLKARVFEANNQIETTIETKCIDVSQADSMYLSFWYSNVAIVNKIYLYTHNSGSNIQIVDSLPINYFSEWERAIFNLTPYLTSPNLEIGLKVIHQSSRNSVFAIDDIQFISQPNPYNVRAKDIFITENCSNASVDLDFTIENIGVDSISSTQFKAYYQLDNNTIVADSFTTSIGISESYTHHFNQSLLNLSPNQTYAVRTWLEKAGDSLKSDDTLLTNFTFTGLLDSLNEDFEQFVDVSCYYGYNDQLMNGWYSPNQTWSVRNLQKCFSYPLDHKGDTGTFLSVDNYNLINNGKLAEIYSPCVDISSMAQPVLTYWLYKFEFVGTLDTMRVEILNNGNWQLIDTTTGYPQNGVYDPWSKKTVDLSAFVNSSPIQLRFSTMIRGIANEVILIDDVSIADSLTTSNPDINKLAQTIKLYPNPSIGQFTLDVGQTFLGENYQIRELSGKVVQEGTISSSKSRIQLNENAKGIYLLIVPNRNVQEKIVVF